MHTQTLRETGRAETQPQPEPSPPASTAAASAEEPTETPAAEPSFWVSDSAANQLNAINAKSNTTKKLRVTVESGGCHGFQYKMELTDEYDPAEDILITKNNATIVIDTTSLDFVNGSTLDYVEELIGSSFQVTDNPRAESSCGCKTSFNVKF
ncbi:uncharacterized protein EV422DRAFT_564726 [Fimicolochytrium jonesii]|uniref:uncharacterized protein n=1 Tax=Fimicolochytrium jonesii TaxID=1396493 RepID=UPI0022FDB437|nr:uncharacterized protein EV422DRAFT_564726 [Fimicolochytrium jonesii]KAI8824020.1 hypothetical protein EV422DRAFT_564726 [Fimicolochytrium jonesii]